jgi:hypothetical protein
MNPPTPLAARGSRRRPAHPLGHLPAPGPAGHPGPPLPRPCLNHVQPWVAQHQGTLSALLDKPVLPVHCHDDRLADWLTRPGTGTSFSALECDLNQQILRVYQPPTDLVRIDATTANSYAEVLSEQGLLQFGHSKDDPDRPQLKIAAAVLDPLGLPLATAVLPGNATDAPLYVPAIRAMQQPLGGAGPTWGTARWPPWPRAPSWRRGRTSTCARCRRAGSAGPNAARCCSRSSTARRRYSRYGGPAPRGNRTSW